MTGMSLVGCMDREAGGGKRLCIYAMGRGEGTRVLSAAGAKAGSRGQVEACREVEDEILRGAESAVQRGEMQPIGAECAATSTQHRWPPTHKPPNPQPLCQSQPRLHHRPLTPHATHSPTHPPTRVVECAIQGPIVTNGGHHDDASRSHFSHLLDKGGVQEVGAA